MQKWPTNVICVILMRLRGAGDVEEVEKDVRRGGERLRRLIETRETEQTESDVRFVSGTGRRTRRLGT